MTAISEWAQRIWLLQLESQLVSKDGEAQEASMANVAEMPMHAVTIAIKQQPKPKTLKVT